MCHRISWQELRQFADDLDLQVGDTFKTSLLGRVLFHVVDKELTGWIPPDLAYSALENGFLIDAALWKEGNYVLRVNWIRSIDHGRTED